jgi:two-component system KDP operon response regulator KdpE
LISLLAQNAGTAVSHKQVIAYVWGENSQVDTQFVRVLVGQLRQKIEEDPSNPQLVRTEPGIGYRLELQG